MIINHLVKRCTPVFSENVHFKFNFWFPNCMKATLFSPIFFTHGCSTMYFVKKKITHNSKIFVLLKHYFYMFSLCNVLNKVDFLHYGHQQINVIFSHFVLLIIHYKSLPHCRKFYYTRFKNCFVLTKLSCWEFCYVK